MTYTKNDPGLRRCYLCDETKPATLEFFPKDKNRTGGIGYQCRPCANRVRRERGDQRKNRWMKMTAEERDKKRKTCRNYHVAGGWKSVKISSYRHFDKKRGYTCDLTTDWYKQHIHSKPCTYCGRTGMRMGCDRIDNSRGHCKDNVVPSCGDCNKARLDIFTHEEMLALGPHIARIFASRPGSPSAGSP